MLRSLLALALMVVFVGCQSGPMESKATELEKHQASEQFIKCLIDATRHMDDGISDAYVVAGALVRGPCYQQAQNVVDTFTHGENRRVKEIFSENFFSNSAEDTAVEVILLERKNTRSN